MGPATGKKKTRESVVATARQYKKRHPLFPLVAYACGQWDKKIKGHIYYFGVLRDSVGALRQYKHEVSYLRAGIEPPHDGDGIVAKEVCTQFMDHAKAKHARGELNDPSLNNYRLAAQFIRDHIGDGRIVESLAPRDFSMLRAAITATGRNLRSQKHLIMDCRAIFRWTASMEIVSRPVNFGPEFKPPTVEAIEREKEEVGDVRWVDREALLALLDVADPKMKAMILMGVNCGFQASDIR